MADEQTPPKRDVNEPLTLDASDSTADPDGPLAHLLWMSPVADLGRASMVQATDDPAYAPDPEASATGSDQPSTTVEPVNGAHRSVGDDGLPAISDVGGLEDLYVTTTELPLGDAATEPPRPAYTPPWAEPVAFRPVDSRPDKPVTVEPVPVEPEPPERRRVQPAPVQLDPAVGGDPRRSFEVGGNLRFSTEAGARSLGTWPGDRNDQPYPAALVPHAVPTPVSPARSVRVPGEVRRRAALPTALIDITERRWFWASAAGFFGVIVLGLLVAGNVVPNPLATEPAGVVADSPLPAAPAVDESPEASEADTSSSTGAGSDRLEPDDPTTSAESTTSSTATTARRQVVTTARPTVRSTTAPPSSATTASSTSTSASTTTSSSSTSTTATSSTTDTTTSSSTSEQSTSSSTDTTTATSSSTETTSASTTGDSSDP